MGLQLLQKIKLGGAKKTCLTQSWCHLRRVLRDSNLIGSDDVTYQLDLDLIA